MAEAAENPLIADSNGFENNDEEGSEIDLDLLERKQRGGCLWNSFRSVFLPVGHPKSVADEYDWYQIWDTIQQTAMFVNSHIGQQAIFGFHGVGKPSASVAAAVAVTISRSLVSDIISLMVSTPYAVATYSTHVPLFRVFGEILRAMGNFMEIIAFAFGNVAFIWVGPMLQSVSSSMTGVARSCILQHFAKKANNKDVTLKEINQDKGGKVVGLVGGLFLLGWVGVGRKDMSIPGALLPSMVVCATISLVHVCTNIGAVSVLRVPPATFLLQRVDNGKYVTVDRRAKKLTFSEEPACAEIFKLGNAANVGKTLMTLNDIVYVDSNGVTSEHPSKAHLKVDSKGNHTVFAGGAFRLSSKARTRSLRKGTNPMAQMFFPPGFPRTTPEGFEQYAAFCVIRDITGTPKNVIELLVYWKYIFGVGDSSKSPLFATYLSIYLAAVSTVAGLMSGLPFFARGYRGHAYFVAYLVGPFLGHLVYFVSAILPFKIWMFLVVASICMRSAADVVFSLIRADANRLWASHPEVDLAHITNTSRNRSLILTSFAGGLCIWYTYHLSCSSEAAQPSLGCMVFMFLCLQALDMYAEWNISCILKKLVEDESSQVNGSSDDNRPDDGRAGFGKLPLDNADDSIGRLKTADLVVDLPPASPSRRDGAPSRQGRFNLSICVSTLMMVLGEALAYAALVGTLSAVTTKLEPCNERCLQFKLSTDASDIPATGLWPFPVANGRSKSELVKECQNFGGGQSCHLMPSSRCAKVTLSTCELTSIRRQAENPLAGSKSEWSFVVCLSLYSIFTFLNDGGLKMGFVGPADAVVLQIAATLSMAGMAASALLWASGAMELFFSAVRHEPEICGCYFRMADVPSALALALPLSLVFRLRTKVIITMRAAIVDSGYLSTITFYLPYHFLSRSRSTEQWDIVGMKGLGRGGMDESGGFSAPASFFKTEQAKRAASRLGLGAIAIILIPLLFSSCSLVYRVADLILVLARSTFSIHIHGGNAGTLAMLGVYGMIVLQVFVVGMFLSKATTLRWILRFQLRDENVAEIKNSLVAAHPELSWALESFIVPLSPMAPMAPKQIV